MKNKEKKVPGPARPKAGGLEFLDANLMLGRWTERALLFHDLSGLQAELARNGIAGGLVYHSWSRHYDPAEGNRRLEQELAGAANLYPAAVLLPFATGEFEPAELAAAVRAKRLRAVRLFPVEHRWTLADWNCASLLNFLAAHRLPTFLDLDQADWNEVARILGRYPDLPIIIANTGYRHGRILYPLLEKFPNLYLETSQYVTYEGIEDICRRFGGGRLLFGSRAPFMDLGGARARISYAGIPAADRQAIAAGNLKRLLGVK